MPEKAEIKEQVWKKRIWSIVEATEDETRFRKNLDYFDWFIFVLILLNALAVILETVDHIDAAYGTYFLLFEIFSVFVFTFEYIVRIWACTSQPEYRRPFWGRLKFALTPLAIIDLLAILPFYLAFTTLDLRFIRTLRIFRLLRVLKLVRYSKSISLFGTVLRNRKEELIVTASIVVILMVLSASFIYFAEHGAQPEAFPDIPSSMWWAIVTLTTVGYGDVFPVTTLGKIFAAFIAVLGIGMFALPTGILGASFVEELEKRRRLKTAEKNVCPNCGERLD